MRVLVCGSRDWPKRRVVRVILDGLLVQYPDLQVISGMARGADRHAAEWAQEHGCLLPYPADWKTHGRAAGPIRNSVMLKEGKPDLVVAFTDDLESSRGTHNTVTSARKAQIPVYVVSRPS